MGDTKESNMQWSRTMQGGLDEEAAEKNRQRELEKQNQYCLKEQIEENKTKRAHHRKEFIEAASSHQFPLFTETFISQVEVDAARKAAKEQFREDLNNQMTTSNMLRNLERRRHEEHARKKQAGFVNP